MTTEIHDATGLVADRRNHRACRHEWRLISDEADEFGRVRMFECHKCGHVHFS